jgi:hypothetical protein
VRGWSVFEKAKQEYRYELMAYWQISLIKVKGPLRHLMQFHWCWIQPLFNFVYRPAFTRELPQPDSANGTDLAQET